MPGGPTLVVEGVGQQLVAIGLGSLVARVDQGLALGVVADGRLANRHQHDDVGKLDGEIDVLHDAGGEGTVEHAHQRGHIADEQWSILQPNGDHHVGVKIVAHHIGGQIVHDAAIYQVVAVGRLDRRKQARDGDRWQYRFGQGAAGKSNRPQRGQVGGHAAEGDGHAVEVELGAVVAQQVGIEEVADSAVSEQGVLQFEPMRNAHGERGGVFAAILAAAKA
jgi:hypothetical protein